MRPGDPFAAIGGYMKILVNGEETEFRGGNVRDLLASLDIDPVRVAVEVNLDIVPKAEYGETVLREGDSIEIVQFVGGGR
jgi:sulfur carrier protein